MAPSTVRAAHFVLFLSCGLAMPAAAQTLPHAGFFLEPAVQYGRAVDQVRFRESTQRLAADIGVQRTLGDPLRDTHRVGLSLHGSFGSRDAYLALRPRYTHRFNDLVGATVSAGWIFATPQQDNAPEDATLSENGFVGGMRMSHGHAALGVDVRVLDVGPSLGYEGSTETTVLGSLTFLGTPGFMAAAFGAGVLLVLSAVYVASL